MSVDSFPTPTSLLADKFYGAAPKNPTPEVGAEPPKEPVEVVLQPEDDEVTPEAGVEPEAPQEATETVSEGQSDEMELQTFEQLAEHLEADPEYLQNLTIIQKVNGESRQVKLSDALTTYRKVEAADSYLSEAKVKAKAIVSEVREQKEALGESIAVVSSVLQSFDEAIDRDMKSTNWAQLRADDPAEYTARRQDIEDRRKEQDARKQSVVAKYRETLAQVQAREDAARTARLPDEYKKLIELVPEWATEEKAALERPEVQKYMQGLGFDDTEIQSASFRGPYLALAIKAMRYDNAKGKSQAAKKKVILIPKVIKPGKKPDAKETKPDSSDRTKTLYG